MRVLLLHADVAVLDWMLPGVSGVELAREARASGLMLPTLLGLNLAKVEILANMAGDVTSRAAAARASSV